MISRWWGWLISTNACKSWKNQWKNWKIKRQRAKRTQRKRASHWKSKERRRFGTARRSSTRLPFLSWIKKYRINSLLISAKMFKFKKLRVMIILKNKKKSTKTKTWRPRFPWATTTTTMENKSSIFRWPLKEANIASSFCTFWKMMPHFHSPQEEPALIR